MCGRSGRIVRAGQLFEALLITFFAAMPVRKVTAFTGEQDTRIWRVPEYYVTRERAKLDFSGVERVGVDETAAARGQDDRAHRRREDFQGFLPR